MPLFSNLLLAFGFGTRLAPARLVTGAQLAASLPWFPLAGAVVGLVLALPPWLGLLREHPLVLAVLLTGANVWITRGLHWDGWADLWDGWGSGATGERFWEIVKDSRCGVFGVLGLLLGLLLQSALFAAMLQQGAWSVIIWCPLLGRVAVLLLACWCADLTRAGMGRDFLQAAGPWLLLPAAASLLFGAVFLLAWQAVLLGAGLLLVFLWRLRALARKQQGCNGDFLGAALVGGELCAGLGWVLAA